MRKYSLTGLLLAVFFAGTLLYGQSSKRAARRVTSSSQQGVDRSSSSLYILPEHLYVDMNFYRPPVYAVDSRKNRIGTGTPDLFKQWLVNEISFSFTFRQNNRRTRLVALEGVKVELYLYAPGTARDRESNSRWLCGEQTLACLVVDPEQKSRRYWASLFLPAPYVYLYFPLDPRTGKYDIRRLEGVVIVSDRDGVILGRRAFAYKSKMSSARAKKLFAAVSELRGKKTNNMVMLWPREKTPWAWLDADRFELPDPDADRSLPKEKLRDVQSSLPPSEGEGNKE